MHCDARRGEAMRCHVMRSGAVRSDGFFFCDFCDFCVFGVFCVFFFVSAVPWSSLSGLGLTHGRFLDAAWMPHGSRMDSYNYDAGWIN